MRKVMETKTINIKDMEPGIIKVEGQSRLTPFESIYIFKLVCRKTEEDIKKEVLSVDNKARMKIGIKVAELLANTENKHPDWHYTDWVEWAEGLGNED